MILVTRLNGAVFALNPDLVERADSAPDTVVTLLDGTKYVISESLPEFIDLIRDHRAAVIAQAQHLVAHPADEGDSLTAPASRDASGNVVQLHRRER